MAASKLLNLNVFLILPILSVFSICPENWHQGSRKCYLQITGARLDQSEKLCAQHDAQVLKIESAIENDEITNLTQTNNPKWLGMRPFASPASYIWFDNSLAGFLNYKDQDRSCSIGEPCCTIFLSSGKWMLSRCDFPYEIWCEISIDIMAHKMASKYQELRKNISMAAKVLEAENAKSENIRELSNKLEHLSKVLEHIPGSKHDLKSMSTMLSAGAILISIFVLVLVIVNRRKFDHGSSSVSRFEKRRPKYQKANRTTSSSSFIHIPPPPSREQLEHPRTCSKVRESSNFAFRDFNHGTNETFGVKDQNVSKNGSSSRYNEPPVYAAPQRTSQSDLYNQDLSFADQDNVEGINL